MKMVCMIVSLVEVAACGDVGITMSGGHVLLLP